MATRPKIITPLDVGASFDYIDVFYARGDLEFSSGRTRKNLQPVGIVDKNYQENFFVISDEMERIYIHTQEPRANKAAILRGIEESWDDATEDKHLLNIDILSDSVKARMYTRDGRTCTKERIEPIDLRRGTIPIRHTTRTFTPVRDVMAWTGGLVTVGSGGTYATLQVAATDAGTFTSNGILRVISHITETNSAFFDNDNSTYSMTITNGDTEGNPTLGYIISLNHTVNGIVIVPSGSGDIIVENLHIKRLQGGASSAAALRITSTTSTGLWTIRSCMIDGDSMTGHGFRCSNPNPTLNIYDNLFYDWTSQAAIIIDASDGNANSIYENNTYYNSIIGADYTNNAGKSNNECFADCTTDQANSGSLSVNTNNVSVSAANLLTEFASATKADGANFLLPLITGNVYGGQGTALIAGNTTHINGVTPLNSAGAKGVVLGGVKGSGSGIGLALKLGLSL